MTKKDQEKINIHQRINAAFLEAQKLIGGARKSSTNPHFKSKYADLTECFNACSDILNEHEISIRQPTMFENGAYIVRTILTHNGGETLEDYGVPILGWETAKNAAQSFGAGQTYARRYSLTSMVGICPEDDDGNSQGKHTPPKPTVVYPDGWGISKIKTELRDFYSEMHACEDADQLEIYKESKKDFLVIVKNHYPEGLFGDDGDINGLAKDYQALLEKLQGETA